MAPEWMERVLQAARAQTSPTDEAELVSLDRLAAQLRFVFELDRAKTVLRRNYLTDGSRLENDAEHMWHVMLAGLILAEHADEPVDGLHLALMLAVHDIVEIDAGDTFIYDEVGKATQAERERQAAERIFGILPPDQASRFAGLFEEFEARETPASRMAAAIDRLLPLVMNRATHGRSWRDHGVGADRVFAVNSRIGEASKRLWAVGAAMLASAVEEGALEAGPGPG